MSQTQAKKHLPPMPISKIVHIIIGLTTMLIGHHLNLL